LIYAVRDTLICAARDILTCFARDTLDSGTRSPEHAGQTSTKKEPFYSSHYAHRFPQVRNLTT